MNRNHQIISLRPEVIIDTDRASLAIERFQNNVLRPILKFQHELLVDYFKSHSAYQLLPANVQERAAVLQNNFNKDVALRNIYLGFVVGLFTHEELAFYKLHQSELNKRVIQMLLQRLLSAL